MLARDVLKNSLDKKTKKNLTKKINLREIIYSKTIKIT